MSWHISESGEREHVIKRVNASFDLSIECAGGDKRFVNEYEHARAAVLAVIAATPGDHLHVATYGHWSYGAVLPLAGEFHITVQP